MHGGPPLPTSDRSETLFCIVGWCYMLLRCFLFWKLNEACVRALVDLNFHVRGAGPKPLKSSGVHERASPSPPRVLDRPRRPRAHGKVHQSSHHLLIKTVQIEFSDSPFISALSGACERRSGDQNGRNHTHPGPFGSPNDVY